MDNHNILEVKHLQKAFGHQEVLKDINFSIPQGKIIGLLGKNGSGKTTLIKSILGLLNHSGEVYFDGIPLNHKDVNVMNSIGVLVDTAFFEDMSAYENLKILMLSTPNRDNSQIKKDIVDLLSFVGLNENASEKVKGFSFGMKQRLALAQALINEPKLLILDEPFVGLDPLGIVLVKEKLIELCKQKNTAIIFSSHQLAEVEELSEDLVVIEDGHIKYFGTYSELARKNKEYRIVLNKSISDEIKQKIRNQNIEIKLNDDGTQVILSHGETTLDPLLKYLHKNEFVINEIIREDKPLEALFV